MLPRGHAKFRAKPTPFGRETGVHGSRARPEAPRNPDPKNGFFGSDDVQTCYRGPTQSFVQNRLRLVVKRTYEARPARPEAPKNPYPENRFFGPDEVQTCYRGLTQSFVQNRLRSVVKRTFTARRRVPRPRKIPTRKTDFLVRTKFKHVTEAPRKVSCKTDFVWSSNGRTRLAGASRGPEKSRPGKQIFWSERSSNMLPRPHAKFRAKPTPFGRQTDVHGARGRTGTPGPAPGKSPTRNPDFFFGMMFFYVPEASCKISAKTDPVWASYQKLCELRKSMFVPVTCLFVHKVYIGGTMGSGAPRAAARERQGRGARGWS